MTTSSIGWARVVVAIGSVVGVSGCGDSGATVSWDARPCNAAYVNCFHPALATGAAKPLHYYDISIAFDSATFVSNAVSVVETCHLYVTGADTADVYIMHNCPPPNGGLVLGTVEYSSMADAGSLTFEMKVYDGIPEDSICLFGQGSATVPIGAAETAANLQIEQTAPGCS